MSVNKISEVNAGGTIRVGLIGCGRIAKHHMKFITEEENVEIVGIADVDETRARSLGEKYGVQKVYNCLEDLLDSGNLDVLHILTPPQYHHSHTLAAIERKVSVFVEKPVGINAGEVIEMYDRADNMGVAICPDFIQLYHPLTQRMISLVEGGSLGRIVNVECNLSLDLSSREVRESQTLHWSYRLPGGILHDSISHPLYMALVWTGSPRRVTVSPKSFGTLPQGLTDHLDILLEGDSVNAHLTLSAVTKPRSYYVRLFCERGVITVDFNALTIVVEPVGNLPGSVSRLLSNYSRAYQLAAGGMKTVYGFLRKTVVPYQGLQMLIHEYYESVITGSPPPISRALCVDVSKAEETIFPQAGKLHLDNRPKPSEQTGIKCTERVLVTGASGYLGSEIVRQLVGNGYYVRAFVRQLSQTHELEKLGVELMYGDIRDYNSLRTAVEGMDIIIHAGAALSGTKDYILDSNVGGTKNVARVAGEEGVKRVIYISSLSIYDYFSMRKGDVITEDSPLENNPEIRGAATLGKRLAEEVALANLAGSEPSWTILRPALIFGNNRDIVSLFGQRVGNLVVRFGSRRKLMRLIHVRDVSSVVVRVIQTDATRGRKYTLSHPDRMKAGEFLRECIWQSRRQKIRVVYIPYLFGRLAFTALGLALRIVGKRFKVDKRKLAYACRNIKVDSTSIMRDTGWRPSKGLLHQLQEEISI